MIMSHTTYHVLDQFQHLTFIGHVSHFLSSHTNQNIFPSKSIRRHDFHETEETFWDGGDDCSRYLCKWSDNRKYKMCCNTPVTIFFLFVFLHSYCNSVPFVIIRQRVLSCFCLCHEVWNTMLCNEEDFVANLLQMNLFFIDTCNEPKREIKKYFKKWKILVIYNIMQKSWTIYQTEIVCPYWTNIINI